MDGGRENLGSSIPRSLQEKRQGPTSQQKLDNLPAASPGPLQPIRDAAQLSEDGANVITI